MRTGLGTAAVAACLVLTGCSDPIRQVTPSTTSTPAVVPTELASLFLTGEEARAATGLASQGEPSTEGEPAKRGGDRPYPCAQMVAGPRDAAVIGAGYVGYRSIRSSASGGQPWYAQTIALYPQETDAKSMFERLGVKLDECRAAPDTGGIVAAMKSTATQDQWTYTIAGSSELCGVEVRRVDNVVIGVEVCRTGRDVESAAKIAELISAKIRAA